MLENAHVFVRWHVDQLEGRFTSEIQSSDICRGQAPVVWTWQRSLGFVWQEVQALKVFQFLVAERHWRTHGSQKTEVGTNGAGLSLSGGKFLMLPRKLRIKEELALGSGVVRKPKGSQPHTGGLSLRLTAFFLCASSCDSARGAVGLGGWRGRCGIGPLRVLRPVMASSSFP